MKRKIRPFARFGEQPFPWLEKAPERHWLDCPPQRRAKGGKVFLYLLRHWQEGPMEVHQGRLRRDRWLPYGKKWWYQIYNAEHRSWSTYNVTYWAKGPVSSRFTWVVRLWEHGFVRDEANGRRDIICDTPERLLSWTSSRLSSHQPRQRLGELKQLRHLIKEGEGSVHQTTY